MKRATSIKCVGMLFLLAAVSWGAVKAEIPKELHNMMHGMTDVEKAALADAADHFLREMYAELKKDVDNQEVYFAPEHLKAEKHWDELADEYARLACYRVLTRQGNPGDEPVTLKVTGDTYSSTALPCHIVPGWDNENCNGKTRYEALENARAQIEEAMAKTREYIMKAKNPRGVVVGGLTLMKLSPAEIERYQRMGYRTIGNALVTAESGETMLLDRSTKIRRFARGAADMFYRILMAVGRPFVATTYTERLDSERPQPR